MTSIIAKKKKNQHVLKNKNPDLKCTIIYNNKKIYNIHISEKWVKKSCQIGFKIFPMFTFWQCVKKIIINLNIK